MALLDGTAAATTFASRRNPRQLSQVNLATVDLWRSAVRGSFSVLYTHFAPDAEFLFCGKRIRGVPAFRAALSEFLVSAGSPSVFSVADKFANDGRSLFAHKYTATWRKDDRHLTVFGYNWGEVNAQGRITFYKTDCGVEHVECFRSALSGRRRKACCKTDPSSIVDDETGSDSSSVSGFEESWN